MNPDVECECVNRLQRDLGFAAGSFTLQSANPPLPDVLLRRENGATEAFEVTELHPDEVPGHGSPARESEESRARMNPAGVHPYWIETNPVPAIVHRVSEKVRKARRYQIPDNAPLSLLIAATLANPGAVASTFLIPFLIGIPEMNRELHGLLENSHFQRVYLHSQLHQAIWEWTRELGWRLLRQAAHSGEGLAALEMLKESARDGHLPGTHIVGMGADRTSS